MTPLGRYFTVGWLMFKSCLIREMQFRANFAIRLFTEFLWLGMQLVYVGVVYAHTPEIGGWNQWHMLILVGTNHIINQLFEALFFDNCSRLVDQIRLGDLDFVLVKPMNSQFLVSLRYTDYASIFNSLIGVGLIVFALGKLDAHPGPVEVLLFALFVANGILLLYAMMFCLSVLTFWIGRASNLFELYYQFGQFARNPGEIYGEVYRWGLRLLLLTLIPMLVVSNYPAEVLFRGMDARWAAYGLALGALFFAFTAWLWRRGLKRYRSASS